MEDNKRLTGGQKHMWLMEHRDEILEYMAKYGKGAAMIRFHISHPDTLDRLIKQESEPKQRPDYFDVMHAKGRAELALEEVRELRGQINELKEAYKCFVESVGEQLALKLFLPLLRSIIKVDDPRLEPKPDNRLSLDDWFNVPEQLEQPKNYSVVAEAEELLNESPGDLDNLIRNWVDLSYRYEEALDNEDWKLALGIYHILRETEPILSKQLPDNTDLPSDKSR